MSEQDAQGFVEQAKQKAGEALDQATGEGQSAGAAVRNAADQAAQQGSTIDAGDVDTSLLDNQG